MLGVSRVKEEIRTDNTDVIANACKKIAELEKQNELLAKHILELQADKGRLTDKLTEKDKQIEELKKGGCRLVNCNGRENGIELIKAKKRIAELEAQIEKMKCCYNCKHSRTDFEHCKTDKHEKWEVKENALS